MLGTDLVGTKVSGNVAFVNKVKGIDAKRANLDTPATVNTIEI